MTSESDPRQFEASRRVLATLLLAIVLTMVGLIVLAPRRALASALVTDVYTGDYHYMLWDDQTASATVTDTSKISYGALQASVSQGGVTYRLTDLGSCFAGCTALRTAPTIPSSVTNLAWCFGGCSSLTTAPSIPSSVTDMSYCFRDCTSLTTAPSIPSSVTDMSNCFDGCTALRTTPAIPSSVTDMSNCFYDCSSLTVAPSIPSSVTDMYGCFAGCTALTIAPSIPSSVTDMGACFTRCTALTTVPSIPSSVTEMRSCFKGCTALIGVIAVHGTPTSYSDCFVNTTQPIKLSVQDSSSMPTWSKIASKYSNVTIEWLPELEQAISSAEDIERVHISPDGYDIEPADLWTTQAELDALNSAISAAQATLDDPKASATDVADAVSALNAAVARYEAAKKPGLKTDSGAPKEAAETPASEPKEGKSTVPTAERAPKAQGTPASTKVTSAPSPSTGDLASPVLLLASLSVASTGSGLLLRLRRDSRFQ